MAKATAKHPFLPLFVGDFMAATAEWEGEEQALYGLLLMHQWALGHLPIEVSKLARLVRWDIRNFERYWPTVAGKFDTRKVPGFGPRLLNGRLEEHRAKSLAISEKRSHVGKLGAEAKWQKDGSSHTEQVASAKDGDGKSHDYANGKRNAIHPIPSHPIHPDPSEVLTPSSQDPNVCTPGKGAGITRAIESEKGIGSAGAESREAPDTHALTERVKAIYPAGTYRGSNWILAERALSKLLNAGEDPDELVRLTDEFRAQQDAKKSTGTQYVLSPEKFFGSDGHWRGPFPLPQAISPKPAALSMDELRAKYPEAASG